MALRPFRFPDDIDVMLDVTVRAFQFPEHPEWNVPHNLPQLLAPQIRAVRQLWPLVRLVSIIQPHLRTLFGGFLWEEAGQVVGVANILRPTASPHYEIGNVGVLASHRGQGIGHSLVEASLDYIQDCGGELAFLKVIEGNTAAIAMYEQLGFQYYDESWEMSRYEEATSMPTWPELPPQVEWRRFGFGVDSGRHRLARRVIAPSSQVMEPQTPPKYQIHWLLRALAPVYHWLCDVRFRGIMIADEDERVLATMEVLMQNEANTATLLVDAEYEELAMAMLCLLMGYCPLTLSVRQQWLMSMALEAGFSLDFRYLRMGLWL